MAAMKVFCSHRSTDKPAVEDFARRLRDRGIDAWLDKWEIQSGHDLVEQINRGLEQCDVGLVFFSSQSSSGKWVSAEVGALISAMVEDGKPIIPVMIDSHAEVPPLLRPRARRGIEEFEQIVDAILNRTRKPELGPPPAPVWPRPRTSRCHSACGRPMRISCAANCTELAAVPKMLRESHWKRPSPSSDAN